MHMRIRVPWYWRADSAITKVWLRKELGHIWIIWACLPVSCKSIWAIVEQRRRKAREGGKEGLFLPCINPWLSPAWQKWPTAPFNLFSSQNHRQRAYCLHWVSRILAKMRPYNLLSVAFIAVAAVSGKCTHPIGFQDCVRDASQC